MVVGRLLSYWEGHFSGAMLNFGRILRGKTDPKVWYLGASGTRLNSSPLMCRKKIVPKNSSSFMQGHPTVKHFNGEWVWDTRFMFPALVVSRIFDSGMVKKCMRKNHLRRKTQGFKYHGFYKSGFHPTLPLAKIDQFTDPLDSGIPKCCWKRYWKEKTDIAPENWRLGYFYSWAGPIFGGWASCSFLGETLPICRNICSCNLITSKICSSCTQSARE